MTPLKCGCRLMTVEECLLERGHFSPKDQDYGIKYCPMHAAAPEMLDALQYCKAACRRRGFTFLDVKLNHALKGVK